MKRTHESGQEFCSHLLHQPQDVVVSTLEWLQTHHDPYSVYLHLLCRRGRHGCIDTLCAGINNKHLQCCCW